MKHRKNYRASIQKIRGFAHGAQMLITVVSAMAVSYGVYTAQVVPSTPFI